MHFLARYRWSCADWRTAASPSIDELKAANAAKIRMETGVSTRELEAIKNGEDFYNNVENLKREAQEMGLNNE